MIFIITLCIIINWLSILCYWLLIAGVTLRVIMKRRAVPAAMSWLLVIYILPIFGIIIYLLFGEFNLDKNRKQRSKAIWQSTTKWIENLKTYQCIFASQNSELAKSLFKLCEHRQGFKGIKVNNIQLLTNTDDAFKMLINDIYQAKNNIEIIFYIWQSGGLVDKVTEALIIAARRGVSCRLILDSAGSMNFFHSSYPSIMRAAGINIVEALNVNILHIFIRRMDLRQHRKMILIDNYIAYTGSMNMVDPHFFKKNVGIGQWIDIMTRMEGPIATAMGMIFSCDWEIETGEHILPPPQDVNLIPFSTNSKYIIQIIASGPGFPEGFIHQALLISIYAARKKIFITTPYLVPSDDLLYALCTAAQRGVKVYIIIPRNNDSLLVTWASRAFFTELLEAGVQIYQFENGLLHTKSVLIDEQLSLIGTVNLDMRSLWLNFEITLVIDDINFSNALSKIQNNYLTHSSIIEAKIWSQRPYWQRIIEKLFYLLSPLL
ncbi:Cardiolipin synthase [Candidatus Mikella endobia]|uniref:Cardiolipin synthase A n=1 Tax=Candidatus Mikella endobia TaxID=1778264 RepID=A0A143WPS6_9ENTR|nr:cardiolipin synthase [Candidatus Mikella endobia]CUX95796.1 Cardiolipin synthase [Candidatus Mikella endobia]